MYIYIYIYGAWSTDPCGNSLGGQDNTTPYFNAQFQNIFDINFQKNKFKF